MTEIQAQVSLYPLGREDYVAPIDAFIEVVALSGLRYEVHSLSTEVSGDDEEVFRVLHAAYARAMQDAPSVMVLTVTNACPVRLVSRSANAPAQPPSPPPGNTLR